MITKYASFEVSEILDVKGTLQRFKTASLDKVADFEDYRTEDGFLYARIRAISSRVNKNNDGWPSVELAGGQDVWDRLASIRESSRGEGFVVETDAKQKYGYSTFLGKPVFVDHHNSDPKKARGVIVDAKLHVEDHKIAADLDPYYADAPESHTPPTWVELLLEVDAKSFPKLAKAIVEGSENPNKGIDGFSMGCDVERSVCSICKNAATSPEEYCNHVKLKGADFDSFSHDGKKTSKKAYEDCYGIKFFEISAVFDPADETALLREVRSSVEKEADAEAPKLPGSPLGSRTAVGVPDHPPIPESEEVTQHSLDTISCPQCGDDNVNWQMNFTRGEKEKQCPTCGYRNKEDLRGGPQDALEQNFHSPTTPHPLGSIAKTAAGGVPQSELTKAPEEVDTLRKERVCPVCGQDIESTECAVCGYEPPPDGLDNPDLGKAQERSERLDEEAIAPDLNQGTPSDVQEGSPLGARNTHRTREVKSEMWNPEITPRMAAVLAERQSDEPREEVVKDETKPTTARTADDMISGANKETTVTDPKVAAEPADPSAKPKQQVDVNGVGGVDEASNDQASKADAQVAGDGKGGTGVEDVSADETQSIEETADDNAGFDKTKNTDDSGHTKTWPNKNQQNPVTDKAYPTSAKKGTDPADPSAKPDDRVDLEQEVNVSWNGGDANDQWTGTGGNGVTRQQNPVTPKVDPNINVSRNSSVLFAAFKLADQEVELGLIEKSKKYDRISELERKSPESLRELQEYASKVKTAGLSRATTKAAHKIPSLSPKAAASVEASEETVDQDVSDSALFGL